MGKIYKKICWKVAAILNNFCSHPPAPIDIQFRFEEIEKESGIQFYNACGYLTVSGPQYKEFQVILSINRLIIRKVFYERGFNNF